MTAYILLVVATLAVAELFLRLPIIKTVRQSMALAAKSTKLIQAEKVSDHWKERALPAYSGAMFLKTLQLCGYLLAAFSPVAVAIAVAQFLGAPLAALFVSATGIMASLVVAVVYGFVRLRLVS